MIIDFYKYHGAGNDFVIIDETKARSYLDPATVVSICDRHTGIGGDGLILLRKTRESVFEMEYFNSDGSTGTLCGNGGRCAAALADFLTVQPLDDYTLEASDGAHGASIKERRGNLSVVRFELLDVTETASLPEGVFLNTGSPHLVCFRDNIDETDVHNEGRTLRYAERFKPSGTNINFTQVIDDSIYVRTYERGVEDETLSCGTGVTAAALAFAVRSGMHEGPVKVKTRGGELIVHFKRKPDNSFTEISLEGPAVKVFAGHIELWNIRKSE